MNGHDETSDECIRGRLGHHDGAPSGQDPGIVCFWSNDGDDDDNGDGDADDCEYDNGEQRWMWRRRARQANHDDNVPLVGTERLAEDGQSQWSER